MEFISSTQAELVSVSKNKIMNNLSTLLLLLITACHIQAQTLEEKLHSKLDSISQQPGLVGFGVSVFSADSVLYQKGYGYADKEIKKPYKVTTVQNIASISKTFIGVSLMKAVELGLFSMDTPINDILPFKVVHPKYPNKKITIAHLATHTSGIIDLEKSYDKSYIIENPEAVDISIYDKKIRKEIKNLLLNKNKSLGEYLKQYLKPKGVLYSKNNFLKKAPGSTYEYSNIAAALAGYCIEVASRKPFPEFTQHYIFDKIGMKDTGWSYDAINKENHSNLYSNNQEVLPNYSLVTYPDGGLRTSIVSLTKYVQELINCYNGKGTVLSADSCKEMMLGKLDKSHYRTKKELKKNYGYFWERRNSSIGHNGGDPGVVTLMYYFEDIKIGAIFFTNTNAIGNPVTTKQIQASWAAIRKYQKEIGK